MAGTGKNLYIIIDLTAVRCFFLQLILHTILLIKNLNVLMQFYCFFNSSFCHIINHFQALHHLPRHSKKFFKNVLWSVMFFLLFLMHVLLYKVSTFQLLWQEKTSYLLFITNLFLVYFVILKILWEFIVFPYVRPCLLHISLSACLWWPNKSDVLQ